MPKYLNYGEFKKFFRNKLKVDCHKINSPTSIRKAYVTFKTLEMKERALEVINGGEWKFKGNVIKAKNARAKVDAMAAGSTESRKRKSAGADSESLPKKTVKIANPLEMLKDSTIPLHAVPYEEQLKVKHKKVCLYILFNELCFYLN